jgi:hypothetical protein
MDTRFWGPSGWRLLHLIATAPPRRQTREFFELLPYVLPCKYCRASLTDYYAVDPVPSAASSVAVTGFGPWLYRIHNRVNGKLRDQKLLKTPNPPWRKIKADYEALYKAPCTKNAMIGWDFLYSVVYTTPCKAVPSEPLPDAPPLLPTPELRNRWNTMERDERVRIISRWWDLVPHVLPYASWRSAFLQGPPRPLLTTGHKHVTEWLFQVEQHICRTLHVAANHKSFGGLCKKLSVFQSKCGSKKTRKTKTCRSKQTRRRSAFRSVV